MPERGGGRLQFAIQRLGRTTDPWFHWVLRRAFIGEEEHESISIAPQSWALDVEK